MIKIKKMLNNNLLCWRHNKETVTAGGIIIPDTNVEKSKFCTVIAKGQGIQVNELNGKERMKEINVGDVVFIMPYHGQPINQGEDNPFIIDLCWIEAIVPEEPPAPEALKLIDEMKNEKIFEGVSEVPSVLNEGITTITTPKGATVEYNEKQRSITVTTPEGARHMICEPTPPDWCFKDAARGEIRPAPGTELPPMTECDDGWEPC